MRPIETLGRKKVLDETHQSESHEIEVIERPLSREEDSDKSSLGQKNQKRFHDDGELLNEVGELSKLEKRELRDLASHINKVLSDEDVSGRDEDIGEGEHFESQEAFLEALSDAEDSEEDRD
ncbi:MAG: hypothetical protein AAF203_02525 [Pseudomonadota bacterium]